MGYRLTIYQMVQTGIQVSFFIIFSFLIIIIFFFFISIGLHKDQFVGAYQGGRGAFRNSYSIPFQGNRNQTRQANGNGVAVGVANHGEAPGIGHNINGMSW